MHLVRMSFSGVPPLTEPVAFRFDERVNVFIGPNASGKSVLLRLLADCVNETKDDSKRLIPHGQNFLGLSLIADEEFDEFIDNPPVSGPPRYLSVSEDWPLFGLGLTREGPKLPTVYIGAVREGLPGRPDQANLDGSDDTAAEVLAGPFSGSRTIRAALRLADELRGPENDDPMARGRLMDAIELANACSQQICAEVIRDSITHNYIPGLDVRGYLNHPLADLNRITILRLMGLNTTDTRNFDHLPYDEQPSYSAYWENPDAVPIYLGHASSGTAGVLLWLRWLALKMVHHYDFAEDWARKPAILLIDEVENHLHPTWQRRVIPALLEHFPGLQIFATTHSPFVVAGLKRGQVHLLQRDAEGVVTASTNERDVIGWTADEILRTMMGVEEPTDQLTVYRAERLRQLRGKEVLTPEEEIELNELRCQVNENLLAKRGPLEAQEERFDKLMRDFLLSRQSDLAQEGG